MVGACMRVRVVVSVAVAVVGAGMRMAVVGAGMRVAVVGAGMRVAVVGVAVVGVAMVGVAMATPVRVTVPSPVRVAMFS